MYHAVTGIVEFRYRIYFLQFDIAFVAEITDESECKHVAYYDLFWMYPEHAEVVGYLCKHMNLLVSQISVFVCKENLNLLEQRKVTCFVG